MASLSESLRPAVEPYYDGPGPALRWTMRGLAAVGLGGSAYLLYAAVVLGGDVPGCGSGMAGDCESVLTSRWSRWLGAPVSAGAVAVYATLLLALAFIGPRWPAWLQRAAWCCLIAGSVLAAGAGLWFVGVQTLKLKQFCPYCLAVHVSGLILAGIVLGRSPLDWDRLEDWDSVSLRPAAALGLVGLGGLMVAALIAGQVLVEPQLYVVQQFDDLPDSAAPPPSPPPQTNQASAGPTHKKIRWLPLLGGRTGLDINDTPILGSPEAPHVIVKLFDYTCPHCRILHHQLNQARQRYGNQLAVVLVPVPMNRDCNRFVQDTHPRHADACEIARLALAVWRVQPALFPELHEWLFAEATARPAAEVRQWVERRLGAERLRFALNDAWINQRIHHGVHMYDICQHGAIPKLVTKRRVFSGEFATANQLLGVLASELGAQPVGP